MLAIQQIYIYTEAKPMIEKSRKTVLALLHASATRVTEKWLGDGNVHLKKYGSQDIVGSAVDTDFISYSTTNASGEHCSIPHPWLFK